MSDFFFTNVANLPTKAQNAITDAAVDAQWVGRAAVTKMGFYLKKLMVPTDVGLVIGTDRMILPSTAKVGEYPASGFRVQRNEGAYGVVTYMVMLNSSADVFTAFADSEQQLHDLAELLEEGARRQEARSRPTPTRRSDPAAAVPQGIPIPALHELGARSDTIELVQELRRLGTLNTPGELLDGDRAVPAAVEVVQRVVPAPQRRVAVVDELHNALISYIAGKAISVAEISTVMGLDDAGPELQAESGFGLSTAAMLALVGHKRFGEDHEGNLIAAMWRENDSMVLDFVVWSAAAIIRFQVAGVIPE